ncbi:MAG: DUF2946 domain-containing protein [Pseudomonadota bacterium]
MAKKSLFRQAQAWIALCAVLLNALVPSVSHAVAYAKGSPPLWEICRADGTRLVGSGDIDFATVTSVTGSGSGSGKKLTVQQKPKPAGMAMTGDCGYCAVHAGSFGLPPSALSGLPVAGGHSLYSFLFYRAPQPLATWSASRPRGPPVPV